MHTLSPPIWYYRLDRLAALLGFPVVRLMIRPRNAAFLALALIAWTPAHAKKENPLDRLAPVPANQPVPVIDFFRPLLFVGPVLNSSGTHFAAIVSKGEDLHDLISFDLATRKFDRVSAGPGFDVTDYSWVNEKRLLFQVAQGKLYASGLYAVELGRFSAAYALERRSVVVPVGFPQSKPLEAILWIKHSVTDRGRDGGVVRIDTRRPLQDRMADTFASVGADDGMRATITQTYPKPPGTAIHYMADAEGELAFVMTSDEGRQKLHRLQDSQWQPVAADLDTLEVLAPGDTPGELLVLAGPEGKPRALHRFDAVSGRMGEQLYHDERYDLAGARVYRSPADRRILGLQYHGTAGQSVWFDPSYQAVQTLLKKSIPNTIVRILGSDRAQKQFFVSASSDTRPTSYHHLDLEAKSCKLLANIAPWLDESRMQPMRPFNYQTRDGFTVEGYVTFPAGCSKERPAPLVVLPHGGPWTRDVWGFDPEVQFLASRGYAVFQPNYRGSSGYEWRFPDEDMWDFRKMHHDVTDGVRSLLKTGLVDAARMAIMGGSFGGFLAISGVAHEPGLYRCAVTIAGVFDWEKLMKDAHHSTYRRSSYGVLRRNLGDPGQEPEVFEAISPIRHVANIKVPVFVAHGAEDFVASAGQSTRLIAEFKRHGVPFEKMIEPNEGHGFRRLENKVELYTAVERFLGEHLAPR